MDYVVELPSKVDRRTGRTSRNRSPLEENLEVAEGIFCPVFDHIDSDILGNSPALRVVIKMGVGIDDIDVEGCNAGKIPIGITPDTWQTNAKADLTMAFFLCAARRVPEAIKDAINGLWHLWTPAGWWERSAMQLLNAQRVLV